MNVATPRRRLRDLPGRVWREVTSGDVRVEVIGGLVVALIVAAVGSAVARVGPFAESPRDTPASPTTAAPASGAVPGESVEPVDLPGCAGGACVALTVVDTVVNGHDDGLYVKACYADASCDRLALARLDQQVYAQCRVDDGLAVDGDQRWVRTPWAFVPGSVAPDGSANASATGQSDPSSEAYGWMAARYLAPRDAVDGLPTCR
jgi:hypothetical protein